MNSALIPQELLYKSLPKKLYELHRKTQFKILEKAHVPPDAREAEQDMVYTLNSIDGMYSYCTGADGRVYHIAAFTEVEKVT
jgi:hypothetical protein